MKLKSDIPLSQSQRLLELLKTASAIFQNFSKNEILALFQSFKMLTFSPGQYLAKYGEEVEYFGVIISGYAMAFEFITKIACYGEGDMIGYFTVMGLHNSERYMFNIVGASEGLIAIITLAELRLLSKRTPELGYKISELAFNKGLDVLHFQYKLFSLDERIIHTTSYTPLKQIESTFADTEEFQDFLFFVQMDYPITLNNASESKTPNVSGLTPFFKHLGTVEFIPGQKIIRSGTVDRAVIFFIKGKLSIFHQDDRRIEVLDEPAILGVQQFLFNKPWNVDIIGKSEGIFYKFSYSDLEDLSNIAGTCGFKIMKGFVHLERAHILDSTQSFFLKRRLYKKSFSSMTAKDHSVSTVTGHSIHPINTEPEKDMFKLIEELHNRLLLIPDYAKRSLEQQHNSFYEIDLQDHSKFIKPPQEEGNLKDTKASPSKIIKDFRSPDEFPPLALHDKFKKTTQVPPKIDNSIPTVFKSSFLNIKLQEQTKKKTIQEAQNARTKTSFDFTSTGFMKKPSSPEKTRYSKSRSSVMSQVAIEEQMRESLLEQYEYEKASYEKFEDEYFKNLELIQHLEKENQTLKKMIQRDLENIQIYQSQQSKHDLLIQIKNKSHQERILNPNQNLSHIHTKALSSTIIEQKDESHLDALVVKCAYKWLKTYKERKYARQKEQANSFFSPRSPLKS